MKNRIFAFNDAVAFEKELVDFGAKKTVRQLYASKSIPKNWSRKN